MATRHGSGGRAMEDIGNYILEVEVLRLKVGDLDWYVEVCKQSNPMILLLTW